MTNISEKANQGHGPRPHHDDEAKRAKARKVCWAYSQGKYSLDHCCEFANISSRTFRRWVDDDPEIATLYREAIFKFQDAETEDLYKISKTNMRRSCEGYEYITKHTRRFFDENGVITGGYEEETEHKQQPSFQAMKYVINNVEQRRLAVAYQEVAREEAETAKANAEIAKAEAARAEAEEKTSKNRSGCMKTLVIMPAEKKMEDLDKSLFTEQERAYLEDKDGQVDADDYKVLEYAKSLPDYNFDKFIAQLRANDEAKNKQHHNSDNQPKTNSPIRNQSTNPQVAVFNFDNFMHEPAPKNRPGSASTNPHISNPPTHKTLSGDNIYLQPNPDKTNVSQVSGGSEFLIKNYSSAYCYEHQIQDGGSLEPE